jgi:hypothetical protein
MKFLVKKQFGKLIPVYNSDAEKLKACKLKEGEVYEVEIKKKRNYEFHKKYFALINLCYDNQDVFDEFDNLRDYLTCKSGFYIKITTPDGEMIKPKSISFANMDNIEFEQLYQKTIGAICKFIDVEEKDILDEIVNYM